MRGARHLVPTLVLLGGLLPARDASAAAVTPALLREKAAALVASGGVRVAKAPSITLRERTILYSFGDVAMPTEWTGSEGMAVLLQAEIELEVFRAHTKLDVVTQLWWRRALEEAETVLAQGLASISERGLSRPAAHVRASQARQRVREEVLVRPLQILAQRLTHDDPGAAPYEVKLAPNYTFRDVDRVTVRVTPPGATVRYESEWDWELWGLEGQDPRAKMNSLPVGEPVLLDGSYYFEVTAPGQPPALVGPRLVDPKVPDVSLP